MEHPATWLTSPASCLAARNVVPFMIDDQAERFTPVVLPRRHLVRALLTIDPLSGYDPLDAPELTARRRGCFSSNVLML